MSAKSANAGFQASPTRKRALLDHLDNRLFQSLDSFSHVLYFVQTAQQSGFPRRMCVVDLLDPQAYPCNNSTAITRDRRFATKHKVRRGWSSVR